jgi:hypothetical protein
MRTTAPGIPATSPHDQYDVSFVSFGVWADVEHKYVLIPNGDAMGDSGAEQVDHDCGLILEETTDVSLGGMLKVKGFTRSNGGRRFRFSRVLVGDTLYKVNGTTVKDKFGLESALEDGDGVSGPMLLQFHRGASRALCALVNRVPLPLRLWRVGNATRKEDGGAGELHEGVAIRAADKLLVSST